MRFLNAPFSFRCSTMLLAMVALSPATRASSGADAMLISTPTELTQSSTTASSERASCGLVDVVLVLANADGFRFDLDEFRQRVLQTARDRYRATQRNVEVRKFLVLRSRTRNKPRRRPPTPSTFVSLRSGIFFMRSPASLSVSRPAVPLPMAMTSTLCFMQSAGQNRQRTVPIVARLVRIDGRCIENLAGLIDDGDLDAGADAGIEPHRHARPPGSREKQIFEVRLENADGGGVGLVLEPHQQIGRKRSVQSGLPGELGPYRSAICPPAGRARRC